MSMAEPEPESAALIEEVTAGSGGGGKKLVNELDGKVDTFTFHHLSEAPSVMDSDADVREKFVQWGFTGEQGLMQRHTFRFDQFYQKYMADQFIKDLLNSEDVQAVFQVPQKGKDPAPLGTVAKVRTREVPCGMTSLSLFDRLGEAGIVREGGSIQKCFDNYIEDLQLADELGKALVDEESENYTLFDDDDREEFLFRVFRHLAIGGGMCQFEDYIAPYLDTTKKIYKDMLAVRKNDETGKIEIVTQVFELRAAKGTGAALFPSKSPYSFCYVVLNPVKRQVTLWYMPWKTMFG
jgi:hypothetical protein